MSKSWPPSALVEDEITSLAREYGSGTSDSESEQDKAPPGSQGAVDQQPIIQDVAAGAEPPKEQQQEFQQTASQQEPNSTPQPQPTRVNEEKRFLYVPGASTNATQKTCEKLPQKPASAKPIDRDSIQRGRPQVSRIYTDFRSGAPKSTPPGQQHTPSPYACQPSATKARAYPDRHLQPSLLSPETDVRNPSEQNSRRARSAHPVHRDRTTTAIESSDSDSKPLHHRRRSKSHVRPKESAADHHHSADEYSFGRRERRRSRHHRADRSPPPEIPRPSTANTRLSQGHRSAHGHLTPPQTPSIARESPYSSAAEDSLPRSRPRHPDHRYSRESPYTSAAEESCKKHTNDGGARDSGPWSGSIKRANKPHLDLHDAGLADRPKLHSPRSTRTPKIIEEDLQRAFEENQKKLPKYRSTHSSRPSPLSSPPTSPPHTEHRSRDYFEVSLPHHNPHKQHSRHPSVDENPIKPLTSLLSAAIGGSMSSKAIHGFPRSSPSPLDTPLSGSHVSIPSGHSSGHSSIPSGQRSRRSSPVHGEPRLGSRNTSTVAKEEIHAPRSSTYAVQHDHPASRPSSVASWDEQIPVHNLPHYAQSNRPSSRAGSFSEPHSARVGGVVLHQDRLSSRNGSYIPASTLYVPSAHRAHSYTSSYDQARVRPSQQRSYSTTNGAVVTPSSSQYAHPPSHAYHVHPSPVTKTNSSPSSATSGGQTITFPKCPYAYPVTEISNWYIMRGLRDFFICSTCIQVIGSSILRDYCVPNGFRAPIEGVACSLSKPWIRIAIARFIQDNTADISLLDSLSHLPDQTLPCPGKNSDVRKWYHITDPTTKLPLANSDSCGACVRSAELIFPELRQQKLFERPADKLLQERRCMLNPTSKHFYRIANELDKLAGYIRKNDLRSKDIVKFGELIKSKSKSRECQRDTMLATPLWHFIPALPEFTICEECFEEVVWPLRDKPIARDVQKTLQPVPAHRPGQVVSGVSCHLYSERMRQVFRDAVDSNDFSYLKRVAQTRFLAEQRLQGTHKALMQDMGNGIDRRADVEKNIAQWKAFE